MANYYWVGGTGTWNASSTTNWALSSGGSGGAGVPTSTDNAYFDGNSDIGSGFTVTVNAGAVCNDLIIGDGTTVSQLDQQLTWSIPGSQSDPQLTIHGSLFLPVSNFGFLNNNSIQGAVRFAATTVGKTITTNGKILTIGRTFFNGVGGGWTLGSALTIGTGNNLGTRFENGTFNTNNYNFTSANFILSSGFNLTLGSSTINVTQVNLGAVWTCSTGANLDAGTSTIVVSNNPGNGPSYPFAGGNKTYYNVEFTTTALSNMVITGNNIFNNLTFASRSSAGVGGITLNDNQTINGTLSVQSGNTDPTRRIRFTSNTLGTQRTITAAAISFGSGIDFQDIVAAGAASPFDVSSLQGGDCLNNSNITFPTPKTVYWNLAGTQNWSANAWATTSGGTPNAVNFPLAQDTCIFDDAGAAGTITLNTGYNLGNVDFSARVIAVTYNVQTVAHVIYGDFILSSNVTFGTTNSDAASIIFIARKNITNLDMKGKNFGCPVAFGNGGGQVNLLSGFTNSNRRMTINGCTLNLGGNEISVGEFIIGSSITQIQFNGGKIIFYRSDSALNGGSSNFSYTGDPDVRMTSTMLTTGMTFNESNAFDLTLTGSGSLSGFSLIFRKLDASGFTGTLTNNRITLFGDMILSPTMTLAHFNNNVNFAKSFGVQKLTTAGLVQPWPIEKSGAATLQLEDNCMISATRTFTHTAGNVNLNGKTLTTGTFSSTGSSVRSVNMNLGRIDCTAANTSFSVSGTNFSTTGLGVINMSNSSNKTFAGGGFQTYPILNIDGTGNLTITGNNKFLNITNSVYPANIIFTANSNTTVESLHLRGRSGNLVNLLSSSSGNRFTITYQ